MLCMVLQSQALNWTLVKNIKINLLLKTAPLCNLHLKISPPPVHSILFLFFLHWCCHKHWKPWHWEHVFQTHKQSPLQASLFTAEISRVSHVDRIAHCESASVIGLDISCICWLLKRRAVHQAQLSVVPRNVKWKWRYSNWLHCYCDAF